MQLKRQAGRRTFWTKFWLSAVGCCLLTVLLSAWEWAHCCRCRQQHQQQIQQQHQPPRRHSNTESNCSRLNCSQFESQLSNVSYKGPRIVATTLLDAQNRVQNETVAAKNFMLPLRLRSDSSNNCSNKSQRARQAYNCGVNWVSCQLSWPGQSKSKSQTPLPVVPECECLVVGSLTGGPLWLLALFLRFWQLSFVWPSVTLKFSHSHSFILPLSYSQNFIIIWQ